MTQLLMASPDADRLEEQHVRDEIQRYFVSRSQRAEKYGTEFSSLWETATRCVVGGKLLRPHLLLGAFNALIPTGQHGRLFQTAAVRIAAATEVLHYAFLLHDDVIDGDLFRRGRPNLIGALLTERGIQESPDHVSQRVSHNDRDLHWAKSSGMLMGNLLLSDTHQMFARESLPSSVRSGLLNLLDHTITESIVGEHLDVALGDGTSVPGLEPVLMMTRLKTATYTFEMPLKAAAILTGAPGEVEDAISEVARQLGSAFQFQDDLLSTFGEIAEHGKDAFSDLREGKETAIIAFARTTDQWKKIEPHFGDPQLNATGAMTIRKHLTDCGAESFVRSLVADQLHGARSILSAPDSPLPPELVTFLMRTMNKLEERSS